MRISFDLMAEDIAEAFIDMRQSDLIELICAIDIRTASVEFTEELIKRLAVSIRCDMSEEDFSALLSEISKGAAQ